MCIRAHRETAAGKRFPYTVRPVSRPTHMRTWLRLNGLSLLAGPAILIAAPVSGSAQLPGAMQTSPPDTGASFTGDMRLIDGKLLEMTRKPLERGGHSFYAFALYVADTPAPPAVDEYGLENTPSLRQPGPIAASLRRTIRRHQTKPPGARTVGFIVDSIAGPFDQAVNGVDGPPFQRLAITELEDRSGRCRRIEREYRFVKDLTENARRETRWDFGRVVYGAPRVTRCEPRLYWPREKFVEAPIRPRLAAPIVRQLSISSLDNNFSVVGRFSGNLTAFDDSIVVRFDTLIATRRLPDNQERIKLDSIRVGVGVGNDTTWSSTDNSKALRVDRTLASGGEITRRNVRFTLPHERKESDDSAWLVVTFHITVGKQGEPGYLPDATTYAHSKRGVLAAGK